MASGDPAILIEIAESWRGTSHVMSLSGRSAGAGVAVGLSGPSGFVRRTLTRRRSPSVPTCIVRSIVLFWKAWAAAAASDMASPTSSSTSELTTSAQWASTSHVVLSKARSGDATLSAEDTERWLL